MILPVRPLDQCFASFETPAARSPHDEVFLIINKYLHPEEARSAVSKDVRALRLPRMARSEIARRGYLSSMIQTPFQCSGGGFSL
jgi:hypothetical protein